MKITAKASRGLVAVSIASVLALSACSTNAAGDAGSDAETIDVNAFSVMEAANEPVFEDFQATDEGKDVEFATSYGASGDQSRAVEAGADADVVHYSLETDVTRSVPAGPSYAPTNPTSRKPACAIDE